MKKLPLALLALSLSLATSVPACVDDDDSILDETEAPLLTSTRAIVGVAGRCLDVMWNESTNGTGVWLYDCNGSPAQEWWIYPNGEIKTPSGKCLSLAYGGTEGSPLILWDCDGGADQKWTPGLDIRGLSGRCVTAPSSGANQSPVVLSTCTGAAGQAWQYPWGSLLKNGGMDACMYVNGSSSRYIARASCQDYDYLNHFMFLPSGVLQTTNGYCLEPESYFRTSPVSGSAVRALPCSGSSHQRWSYSLTSQSFSTGGMCIAVETNSSTLRMRSCNGGALQRWTSFLL
jgi:hypothetical protein